MTNPQQILDYIKTHSRKFGNEQATKDLQTGLNVLNREYGNKAPKIEIDGDYGVQTHAALVNACKNYSTKDIQTNIKHAAVSSVIFDTKNNKKFNTENKVERAYSNFNDDTVLHKGGISNVRYIWQAEGNDPCDECASLDGKEFDNIDDIPDRPHPNCLCNVYVLEEEGEGDSGDDECPCWDELEDMYDELENITSEMEDLASEAESDIDDIETIVSEAERVVSNMEEVLNELEPEVGKHLPDCEFNVDKDYSEIYAQRNVLLMLIRDIISILFPLQTLIRVLHNLVSNFVELLGTRGDMDKYYHSVANCENAQLGIMGSVLSEAACNLKESYDEHKQMQTHKMTKEEVLQDSLADQKANIEGRTRGRLHPDCNCREMMQDLKPSVTTDFSVENLRNFILDKIKIILE